MAKVLIKWKIGSAIQIDGITHQRQPGEVDNIDERIANRYVAAGLADIMKKKEVFVVGVQVDVPTKILEKGTTKISPRPFMQVKEQKSLSEIQRESKPKEKLPNEVLKETKPKAKPKTKRASKKKR